MPPKGGNGKAKAEAAVEEEPAAKKAATMPPKGVGKGKAKADATVEKFSATTLEVLNSKMHRSCTVVRLKRNSPHGVTDDHI